MKKVFLTALCEITVLSLMFVSECRKSADDIEVETSGDAVVWKYASESEWHDLIAIAELTGAAGRTAFLADLTGNPLLK